jgi:hypothetical protein
MNPTSHSKEEELLTLTEIVEMDKGFRVYHLQMDG